MLKNLFSRLDGRTDETAAAAPQLTEHAAQELRQLWEAQAHGVSWYRLLGLASGLALNGVAPVGEAPDWLGVTLSAETRPQVNALLEQLAHDVRASVWAAPSEMTDEVAVQQWLSGLGAAMLADEKRLATLPLFQQGEELNALVVNSFMLPVIFAQERDFQRSTLTFQMTKQNVNAQNRRQFIKRWKVMEADECLGVVNQLLNGTDLAIQLIDNLTEQDELPGEPMAHKQPVRRTAPKIGPNEPCPCGSGKKYKKCHGAPGAAAWPEIQ